MNTNPSLEEEITDALRDIYLRIDDIYQKVKREDRKDLQDRLAQLRDVANTAWINQ